MFCIYFDKKLTLLIVNVLNFACLFQLSTVILVYFPLALMESPPITPMTLRRLIIGSGRRCITCPLFLPQIIRISSSWYIGKAKGRTPCALKPNTEPLYLAWLCCKMVHSQEVTSLTTSTVPLLNLEGQ